MGRLKTVGRCGSDRCCRNPAKGQDGYIIWLGASSDPDRLHAHSRQWKILNYEWINKNALKMSRIIRFVFFWEHGKRRNKSITMPRQVGMWLARRHTRFSLEEIGGYFGGRDHTTVLHACRKIAELRTTDTNTARDFNALIQILRG